MLLLREGIMSKPYPRIWDDDGERVIIGETKFSWIVVERGHESDNWVEQIEALRANPESRIGWMAFDNLKSGGYFVLVSKKTPNKEGSRPTWWLDERSMKDYTFHRNHVASIGQAIRDDTWRRTISPSALRQIAELIDYDETTQKRRKDTK